MRSQTPCPLLITIDPERSAQLLPVEARRDGVLARKLCVKPEFPWSLWLACLGRELKLSNFSGMKCVRRKTLLRARPAVLKWTSSVRLLCAFRSPSVLLRACMDRGKFVLLPQTAVKCPTRWRFESRCRIGTPKLGIRPNPLPAGCRIV